MTIAGFDRYGGSGDMTQYHLLVADDEEVIRTLVQKGLEREGYRVLVAPNGKIASEIVLSNDIDVAILDINMPVMTGLEALREIKTAAPDIEVLMLTGFADMESLRKAIDDYGAFDYILKPFKVPELVGAVKNVLLKREVRIRQQENLLQGRLAHLEREVDAKTRELRESQINYRMIIENNADGILIMDREGSILFANPAAERLFRKSREDLLGNRIGIPLPGRGGAEVEIPVGEGGVLTVEMRVAPADWGGETAFLASLRDTSDRKRAERAVHESEEKYRSLFEGSIDAIYITARDGTFLDVSPSTLELFGLPRDDLIGSRIQRLYADPDDRARFQVEIEKNGFVRNYEIRFKRSCGREIDCLLSAILYRSPDGGILGYQGILRDVTEIKRNQEKLRIAFETLRKTMNEIILTMARTLETRDPYTAGHQQRVAKLAQAIGKEMGFSQEGLEGLYMAGMIHDLGKISVPAEILSKPGAINPIEFALIKNHSQVGFDILSKIDFPWPVARIVLQHHERMDGKGYPHGLSGDEILPEARILAVADLVEAMASHRPYRPALGIESALAEIVQNRGKLYDPDVVDACLRLFREKNYSL
jgi:PAS domain S-box-containing protein